LFSLVFAFLSGRFAQLCPSLGNDSIPTFAPAPVAFRRGRIGVRGKVLELLEFDAGVVGFRDRAGPGLGNGRGEKNGNVTLADAGGDGAILLLSMIECKAATRTFSRSP
jgi:hypothetical protein